MSSSFTSVGKRTTKPCEIITNAAADTNTLGSDITCKAAMVRSHPDNVGIIWVQKDSVAVNGSCWPLNVGDGCELNVNNLNEINVLFESGGDKLSVFCEV